MHKLVFVTVSADRNASSKEVRSRVFSELIKHGFIHFTRFGSGWGDDFEIGGYWSGKLARRPGEPDAGGDRLHPIIAALRGQLVIVNLDQFVADADLGEDHDAVIVTNELYDAYLKPFEGDHEQFPSGECPGYIDLDEDTVSRETHIAPAIEEDSGKVKWLVVVDLHL